MIYYFHKPKPAIDYVLSFNARKVKNHKYSAHIVQSNAIWHDDNQILMFPVLISNKLKLIEQFDVFNCSLNFNERIKDLIREKLNQMLDKNYNVVIIAILEWQLIIQVSNLTKNQEKDVNADLDKLNATITKCMEDEFGRMPIVKAQRDAEDIQNCLFNIGVR